MVSEIFPSTLHKSTPIALEDMTKLLTRLLSLVIGVFEKIDTRITNLDLKIDTLERLPIKTYEYTPQLVDHYSPILTIQNQEMNPRSPSTMEDELRAAIRQRANQNIRIPPKIDNPNNSIQENKMLKNTVKPQMSMLNHSSLHIELKEAFQRLNKTVGE